MPQSAAGQAGLAFRIERRFAKPRENVFRAWTDPQVLKRWWCPPGWAPAEVEVDLRAGGCYRIGMRRESGSPAVYVCGSFVEVDPPARLVYTWQWENAFEHMPPTRVTVEFLSEGTATVVSLVPRAL
jgi:uncharacterized protein YndB with AHSA1/START domain